MQFHPKEVVWAKVKGYPWWPAHISKLPEQPDGNYKVIFFAQDTYALLEPKCIQKFNDNYAEHSKTKAKKFLRALEYANSSVSSNIHMTPAKKTSSSRKKPENKNEVVSLAPESEEEQPESQQLSENQNENMDSNQSSMKEDMPNQLDVEEIDRKKVDKLEAELLEVMQYVQSNATTALATSRDWKYSKYFDGFQQVKLNSEQILQSNITRKLRYIIESIKNWKIDQKQIDKLQQISSSLKKKVLDYLTDTSYYDQHLKLIDKSRHNKAEIQNSISKIMRKKFHGQVKKQFMNIFAGQIGAEVGKNPKFRTKQLISKMKDCEYDEEIRQINSKAATQRFADKIIGFYRE